MNREHEHMIAEMIANALDGVDICVTLSDMRTPDMPLIHVNKAFSELTGYSQEECIGRNCRFLQGEDTDKAAVASMSSALRAGRRVSLVLKNYRKDGTPFLNSLELLPVREPGGEVIAYCGFQAPADRVDIIAKRDKVVAEIGDIESLAHKIYATSPAMVAALKKMNRV